MKQPEKLLIKLNEVFLMKLQRMCENYLENTKDQTYRTTYDSPKWLQFHGYPDLSDNTMMRFKNSNGGSGFFLDLSHLPPEDREIIFGLPFQKKYAHFRELKYHYINKNYPQIPGGLK